MYLPRYKYQAKKSQPYLKHWVTYFWRLACVSRGKTSYCFTFFKQWRMSLSLGSLNLCKDYSLHSIRIQSGTFSVSNGKLKCCKIITYHFLKHTFSYGNQRRRYLQSAWKEPIASLQRSRFLSSTSWIGKEIHWHFPHGQDAHRNDSWTALLLCLLLPTMPPTPSVHRTLRKHEQFQPLPRLWSVRAHYDNS